MQSIKKDTCHTINYMEESIYRRTYLFLMPSQLTITDATFSTYVRTKNIDIKFGASNYSQENDNEISGIQYHNTTFGLHRNM